MAIKFLPCVADTYIHNKIISNKFVATDSNVGNAGTLDMFVLHAESSYLSGSTRITGSQENSRILIKFDLDPIKSLTGSILNLANMSCSLILKNVVGGQTLPTAPFTIETYLMSRSWTENVGRDIIQFADIGEANWHTASINNDGTVNLWATPGAGSSGFVETSTSIDYFTGSALTGNLTGSQTFNDASADLNIDITALVSASLSYPDFIPDAGFIVKFPTGSESGTSTMWIKRFASRHSTSPILRPTIMVRTPDAIQDHRSDFLFNISGSIFFYNSHRGQPANILSGSTSITGANSILLKLESGSYKEYFTGSQHRFGTLPFVSGVYSATFGIDQFHPTLRSEILSAKSCSFVEVWEHLDNTLIMTASNEFIIKQITPSTFSNVPETLFVNVSNMKTEYSLTEIPRFRVEAFLATDDEVKAIKLPLKRRSQIFTKMYYQIRDAYSGDVIVPFDILGEEDGIDATLCSVDSEGMYFDAHFMSGLSFGRVYQIDILIKDAGVSTIFDQLDTKFRVAS